MTKTMAELEASIQEKLDSDTEFQSSIAELSDEDKTAKIGERRQQEFDKELSTLSDKAEKAEENEKWAKNEKIRAEKAEKELKKKGDAQPPKDEQNLSPKDILALRDVHEDDIDEVLKFSKANNLTVAEVKKNKYFSIFLREKAEERKTAEATNSRGGGKGTNTNTADEVVEKARRGEFSEDDSDIEKLAAAQMELKMRKIQK